MAISCIAGLLAGGASKRFGSPKALLELTPGCTMLEHVAMAASAVADEVVILGNPPTLPDSLATIPILADAAPVCGPMGGLCTLLEYCSPRWGLLLACDLPVLRTVVLQRLLQVALNHPQAEVVAFVSSVNHRVYECCCALYNPVLHPLATAALKRGETGLQHLLRVARTIALVPSPSEARALRDVDTMADLDALGDLRA
ncbi:MAG: molybdenum cofactor guanylyltransferase [Phycisphaerae bacterium]|nr:molybdenum cofactor guanylyltransferase [Phycisphaerae bacterium]